MISRLVRCLSRARKMLQLDTRSRVALWVALGGIPVVVFAGAWLVMSESATQTRLARELDGALRAQLLIERARSTMIVMETAQRGYLLTGDDVYLAPYHKGFEVLGELRDELTAELSDNGPQANRLVSLAVLAGRKLDELGETIALARKGDPKAARSVVLEGRGRELMVQMQDHFDQLAAHERAHAIALRASLDDVNRRIDVQVVSASLILLLLSGIACLLGGRALQMAHASRLEAEMANRTKTTFLAMMSHELRTPMNGVLGMAHLLEQSGLNETQTERVRTIRTCGEGLMVVLNDILDISKIEADKFELDACEFDLMDVVRHAMDVWRPAAEMKDLFLDLKVSGASHTQLVGDANRLRQILNNLLSNAVKFTAMGGVYVRVHIDPLVDGRHEVRIAVADTGAGVSPDAQKRLFKPFVQADSSITREYGGTGLGLAISRRLARMMEGDIVLVSEKGAGAMFTFNGVFGHAPSAAPAIADAEDAPETTSVDGLRILVAEDNVHNQVVARCLLEAVGCIVEVVGDGEAAVQACADDSFDLILMDIQMPVLDRTGALNQIRRMPGARGMIPIIALTANARVGDREAYLASGFDDHVPKPIEPVALVEAIGRAVAGARDPQMKHIAA